MSPLAAAWIAWSVCAFCVILLISAWLLTFLASGPRPGVVTTYLTVFFDITLLTLPAVGALIASRRPENPIGWLFCLASLVVVSQAFADSYATYALFTYPGELPGVETMAWTAEWMAFPVVLLTAALVFLLFPEGVLETVYTRLRNEVGHIRAGSTLERTQAEIRANLPAFQTIVKTAIANVV